MPTRARSLVLASLGCVLFLALASCWTDEAPPRSDEEAKAGQMRSDNGLNTTLVWIPPGKFTMGSPKDEKGRGDDENQVQVTLTKGFWLGQHEVTRSEWQRVMQTMPWSGDKYVKVGDDYPATHVSWDDAMKFCEKLTEAEHSAARLPSGWKYTLPTVAQWEYSCRAGTTSRFSFGDDEADLIEYAWFTKNTEDVGERYAHPVARKKPNAWGLYDMHGNVWEWCRDSYAWYAKESVGGTDPEGRRLEDLFREYRGGSFDNTAGGCRSANRNRFTADHWSNGVGFRVAAVPSGK